jgi:hypothetical protein
LELTDQEKADLIVSLIQKDTTREANQTDQSESDPGNI